MKAAAARVLLTGATGGIGRETAAALLLAGAHVMLAARSPDTLRTQAENLAATLDLAPRRVTFAAADLLDRSQLEGLADAAARWECNVVVHAAGVPGFGRFSAAQPGAIEQVLRTNLYAPMVLTQSLLAHLQRQPRAQVIFVGSVLGRIGLPGFSVYSASKFGLRGFAEALRRELAGTAVQVQYLGPRSTRTAFNDEAVEKYNRATGTAMDSPADVARALVAILEDERAERFLGWPERLGVRINGLAPEWLDRSFVPHRSNVSTLRPSRERNVS
jgi:short-subunit dehydrogenase